MLPGSADWTRTAARGCRMLSSPLPPSQAPPPLAGPLHPAQKSRVGEPPSGSCVIIHHQFLELWIPPARTDQSQRAPGVWCLNSGSEEGPDSSPPRCVLGEGQDWVALCPSVCRTPSGHQTFAQQGSVPPKTMLFPWTNQILPFRSLNSSPQSVGGNQGT